MIKLRRGKTIVCEIKGMDENTTERFNDREDHGSVMNVRLNRGTTIEEIVKTKNPKWNVPNIMENTTARVDERDKSKYPYSTPSKRYESHFETGNEKIEPVVTSKFIPSVKEETEIKNKIYSAFGMAENNFTEPCNLGSVAIQNQSINNITDPLKAYGLSEDDFNEPNDDNDVNENTTIEKEEDKKEEMKVNISRQDKNSGLEGQISIEEKYADYIDDEYDNFEKIPKKKNIDNY